MTNIGCTTGPTWIEHCADSLSGRSTNISWSDEILRGMLSVSSIAGYSCMHYCYRSSTSNRVYEPRHIIEFDSSDPVKIFLAKNHPNDSRCSHDYIDGQEAEP
jgi:hypothetical protein